ncbi:serine/threonine-protein phosphatase [Rhodohalobacter sp. SW132]|uniref:PP2C family protein-serine/threonine phosphatase n=1 Tax=Rhodohalobacter sp. SW132 TaxID=2293433 RepID=UPI000E25BF59|nr:PP2C family protein-serine/threonine phosphatase [Rhodohalobacter sp. SW132]REL38145.1 serine/threonine-protein phosphatase [Rhodohalobacter sp. SW132]
MGLKNEAKSVYDTKTFYKEYVSGMNSHQLGKEFQSDSERLKKLYDDALKENNPSVKPEEIPFMQKVLTLLSALTKRLNPVRRLIFGVALVGFLLYFLISLFEVIGVYTFFSGLKPLLMPVSFIAVLAILLIELLEKSDVQQELNFARDIQLSLLPPSGITNNDLEVYSFAATAREVGGDYVDVVKTPTGTYVLIADVSGKGMSAALYMVRIQALVHLLINKYHPSPKELLLELNDYIKSNKTDKTFVTGCAAFFPNDDNSFTFARAGHNPPVLYSHKHETTFDLRTEGLALGMTSTKILKNNLIEKKFRFEAQDSILFYTDGLSEARNEKGEEYGFERIDGIMSIYGSLHSKTISKKVQSSLESFIGNEKNLDDITFTAVHRNPATAAVMNQK